MHTAGNDLNTRQYRPVLCIGKHDYREVVSCHPDRQSQIEQRRTAADDQLAGLGVDAGQPSVAIPELQAVFLKMLIRTAFADPGTQLDTVVRENPEPPWLGVKDRWRTLHRLEQAEYAVGGIRGVKR